MKTKVNLYLAGKVDRLVWPEAVYTLDLSSSALSVITDFRKHMPLVVNHDMQATEVEASMRRQHVRLKLVVDARENFLGVIGIEDLGEVEILKQVANGYDRKELRVADFMCSKHTLHALSYEELGNAQIGDILDTLKTSDRQHCLVIERYTQALRGIISASDITRQLKLPLDLSRQVSFARIYRALYPEAYSAAIPFPPGSAPSFPSLG